MNTKEINNDNNNKYQQTTLTKKPTKNNQPITSDVNGPVPLILMVSTKQPTSYHQPVTHASYLAVNVDGPVPFILMDIFHERVVHDTCAVDQDVHGTQCHLCLLYQLLNLQTFQLRYMYTGNLCWPLTCTQLQKFH